MLAVPDESGESLGRSERAVYSRVTLEPSAPAAASRSRADSAGADVWDSNSSRDGPARVTRLDGLDETGPRQGRQSAVGGVLRDA